MIVSYNYKTYYLGTPKDLEDSDTLILLKKPSDFNISLETLSELEKLISENPEEYDSRTAHKDENGDFYLSLGGNKKFEFDVIIYNNISSGYVGYTIFSSSQKCYSSGGIPFGYLKIDIILNRIEGESNKVLIELVTYLDKNVENRKILGNTERWEYQESKYINIPDSENSYLKFTNRIPDFLGDQDLCIVTDSGFISHKDGVFGSFILSGVEIDADSFSTIKPVYYKGDLAILKYSNQTGEFCVSSLTSLNPFGRPLDYLSGVIENIPEEFISYNGQVLLFSEGENYLIYSMETNQSSKYPKITENSRNYIILDPKDPTGQIRYLKEEDLKEEISRNCIVPERFIENSYYSYSGKNGEWWIFKLQGKYIYISIYGIIYSDKELEFVNNRIGLYIEPINGTYHFIPIDLGHEYEYKDNRFLDKTTKDYIDITIKPSDTISSLSPELRCFLDGLRRKPLRTRGCLPKNSVLGVGSGLILYLSEGLLYCY